MNAHACRRPIALGALLTVCSAALAAEPVKVLYLNPDKYEARVGEQVSLAVLTGSATDAQAVGLPVERVEWFFVRVAGTQKNLQEDQIREATGDDKSMSITIEHAGVTLVGLDTRPLVQHIGGGQLADFLKTRTVLETQPAELRSINAKRTYRVRRVESAKTLVRAPGSGGDSPHSATAQSKSGQKVEIRPLADPTAVPVGSDLPVRVYADGGKKAGARVLATNVTTGNSQRRLTDPVGATDVEINEAGVWRVEFHHAEKLKDDPDADWVIYSATLTFEVRKGGAGQ